MMRTGAANFPAPPRWFAALIILGVLCSVAVFWLQITNRPHQAGLVSGSAIFQICFFLFLAASRYGVRKSLGAIPLMLGLAACVSMAAIDIGARGHALGAKTLIMAAIYLITFLAFLVCAIRYFRPPMPGARPDAGAG